MDMDGGHGMVRIYIAETIKSSLDEKTLTKKEASMVERNPEKPMIINICNWNRNFGE